MKPTKPNKPSKQIKRNKQRAQKPRQRSEFTGSFSANARGFGFIRCEEFKEDLFVAEEDTNGAMHGDKVLFRVQSGRDGRNHRDKRPQGSIIKIIERGFKTVVGTFYNKDSEGLFVPDNKQFTDMMYVSVRSLTNMRKEGLIDQIPDGSKVVVTPVYSKKSNILIDCRIIEVLGARGDLGVDVMSIVRKYDVPTEFPDEVNDELGSVPTNVSERDIDGRRDIRDLMTVTIDGADTKDIDDAVTISVNERGHFILGVHIADVSYYVREHTALDEHALKRGTSIYLADRVIPMLPPILSNGICSLNEGVDRLSLSCMMEVDKRGHVVSSEVFRAAIKVNKRMTYTDVQKTLDMLDEGGEQSGDSKIAMGASNADTRDEAVISAYKPYADMLLTMRGLYEILRQKRLKRGAIEFDLPESKMVIDEMGKVIDIKPYERNTATGIIEEFMILCNETVAERYAELKTPFVYRTHEEPDAEKLQGLAETLLDFGYKARNKSDSMRMLHNVMNRFAGTNEEGIISRQILRSLKQARYTPENIGHFGLASRCYCHFTSPIRRYPDLQIHRIITMHLNDQLTKEKTKVFHKTLDGICKLCSQTERTAEELEREVDKMKKAQYMQDKVGQEYDGFVSGITQWGIFIELGNTVEGLCPADKLGHETYTLGDKVRVSVEDVDTMQNRIRFSIV